MRDLNQKELLSVIGDVLKEEFDIVRASSSAKHAEIDAKLASLNEYAELSVELRTQIENLREAIKHDSTKIDGHLQSLSSSLVNLQAAITATKSEFDERFAGLDGAMVLKGSAAAIMSANAGALRRFADDILLRRSTTLTGTPPALIRELVE